MPDTRRTLNVVVFTGGRGSSVLSRDLVGDPRVRLTLAINGYDDGLSTGEVRRFLGDALGPSDFRKNASRIASSLSTCPPGLIELLDLRFPDQYADRDAIAALRALGATGEAPADRFGAGVFQLAGSLPRPLRDAVAVRTDAFLTELGRAGRSFSFADCSIGNLVFAGSFLHRGRRFNDAVDDYCAVLGLPAGVIENVTTGANALLVALLDDGRLLTSEASIVTADHPQRIRDIFLIDRPISETEERELQARGAAEVLSFLERRRVEPEANPRLLARIAEADLIIYAPGTQHSSLYPSYLVPGIGAAIVANLRAIKVLITNLHEDAEIHGESAVDLINKALFYLREKGRNTFPAPSLITHYVINDPARAGTDRPYVPLGDVESLDDPRLVRIGNYEDGVTGRHAADRVLTPFVESLLRPDAPVRVGVVLMEAHSLDQIGQTLIEIVRAEVDRAGLAVTAFYDWPEPLDASLAAALPFATANLGGTGWVGLQRALAEHEVDYVVLFDSSGMYKGEDVVGLGRMLRSGRLDAIWGSRRLSINDIRQAYRLVYRDRWWKGLASYAGSHVLSLMCLALYGRYISDTLSGARAVRVDFLGDIDREIGRSDFNHILLSRLLRGRAEVFETPVYYFPISPERVRRTTVADGLSSIATMLRLRWARSLSSKGRDPATVSRLAPVPRFRDGVASGK